jgi:hypothetical protein
MFTLLNVPNSLSGDADPGWYDNLEVETRSASAAELSRDGIEI